MSPRKRNCCCKTLRGRKCGRAFIPKTANQKYCWQHGANRGYTCNRPQHKCPPRKTSPRRKKRGVRFAENPVTDVRRISDESGAHARLKREAYASIRSLSARQNNCINYVLGRLEVWDQDDLAENWDRLSERERKMAQVCLKAMQRKKLSPGERKLIEQVFAAGWEKVQSYRSARLTAPL